MWAAPPHNGGTEATSERTYIRGLEVTLCMNFQTPFLEPDSPKAVPSRMLDSSILASITPISLVGVIVAIVTWGRDLTGKIESIRSNHLSHVEEYTEETRMKTAELVTGQARLEKMHEQTNRLLVEQAKVLVEIKTVLQERG